MRVGVMMSGLLKKLLHTKQNVDSLSEEEIVHGKDTTVATQGRKESKGRTQRGRSSVSSKARDESKSTSKVRGQSSKSKLSSKNGKHERTGKGFKGKPNASSSKSKGMGSK
jgi:hypothetical protein